MECLNEWFDKIYLNHIDKLIAIGMYAGLSRATAEDLAQDVFLLFLKQAQRIKNTYKNPAGFLYITMHNLIGDELRRNRRRGSVQYDDSTTAGICDNYFDTIADHLPAGLKPQEKELLILFYGEQLSYEQMAARYGISAGTCRTRVFRAKEKCKKLLFAEIDFFEKL